jgi:hypothetical protein
MYELFFPYKTGIGCRFGLKRLVAKPDSSIPEPVLPTSIAQIQQAELCRTRGVTANRQYQLENSKNHVRTVHH